MKRFPLFLATLTLGLSLGSVLHAADSATKKVLFFSKSSGFEHSAIKEKDGQPSYAQKVLEKLGANNNIEFTFTKDGGAFTAENLAKFDAFFFYTTGDLTTTGTDKHPGMSKEGKAAFLEAIKNGKGFIGTHSASDTFHSPGSSKETQDAAKRDPYISMLGGEFIVHGAQQKSHMIVKDKNFPGASGIPDDFGPQEEWYALKNFAPNLHVILVQETEGMKGPMYQRAPYPATWARMEGKGRVFYTNMGHREDVWDNPVFQELLAGGINWAVGKVNTPVSPNLDQAAPKANELPQ